MPKTTVIQISEEILQIQCLDDVATSEESQPQGGELASIASMDVSTFNLKPGQLLKGAHIGITKDGDGSRVISIHAADVVNSNLNEVSKGTIESLRLISLPNLPGLEKTATSVKVPENSDDLIQIFLNIQPQRTYYPLSNSDITQLPIMIERDPFSVIHTIIPETCRISSHENDDTL